jgi:hypothetical protein
MVVQHFEVCHVRQENGALDNTVELSATALNDGFQIREDLDDFGFEAAFDFFEVGVDSYLSTGNWAKRGGARTR